MFTRNKQINNISSQVSPLRYIEEINGIQDYANSTLLHTLDSVEDLESITVGGNEYRVDLISHQLYGSVDYSWILLYINRVKIEDLTRDRVIKYIPKNILDSIFKLV